MMTKVSLAADDGLAAIQNLAQAAIVGCVAVVTLGFVLKSTTVSSADAEVFVWLVPKLQSSRALVGFANFVAAVATIAAGQLGGVAIGLIAVVIRRRLVWLPLCIMTMVGAQLFQNFTIALVQRDSPATYVLGTSGGYFSGGVMRAFLLAGMLVSVLFVGRLTSTSDKATSYGASMTLGTIIAVSRITLGVSCRRSKRSPTIVVV